MSAAVAAAPSDAESIRTELEELRSRDAVERETSRQQLASLQEGLAALTSTLEQREQVKREQSEQRLMELRELQGAVAAHNGGKTRSGNLSRQRPSSAGTAGGGSGRRRAAARRPPGRPHSPESSRDLSITVGGRKSKRTVARSTGAVKELGRNALYEDERAVEEASSLRRSSSVWDRERPWRDGGDLTVKPSAAEIVAAHEVSNARQKRFDRKMAAESYLYKDVIARSDVDWNKDVARPKHAGQLAHSEYDLEHRNNGGIERILSTMDDLVGLESEITGKWRRAHRPKTGAVRLRRGGKSLMARSSQRSESTGASSVLRPRQDTNQKITDAAQSGTHTSPAAAKSAGKGGGLRVQVLDPAGGSTSGGSPVQYDQATPAGAILGMRAQEQQRSERDGDGDDSSGGGSPTPQASPLEQWAQQRAIGRAKTKITQIVPGQNRAKEEEAAEGQSQAKQDRAKRAETMFKELDSDNSGSLDRDELRALAGALGTTLSDHEISEAMAEVRRTPFLRLFLLTRSFYQGRLGTSIGKVETNRRGFPAGGQGWRWLCRPGRVHALVRIEP